MYKLASIALFFSAFAHAAVLLIGGLSNSDMVYSCFGVLFLALAFTLFREYRWAAWLAFLLLLIGIPIAIAGFNSHTAPNALYCAIFALNAVALVTLFGVLWHDKSVKRIPLNDK